MSTAPIRILGIDPGLRRMGWGVVEYGSGRLRHVANGLVTSDAKDDLATRLNTETGTSDFNPSQWGVYSP